VLDSSKFADATRPIPLATRRYRLIAPGGSLLDDRNAGFSRMLGLLLTQTGTYRMFVSSYASTFGSFSVGLSDHPVEILPALLLGVPQVDAISPYGDVDDRTFSGTAGQVVTFLADTTSTTDLKIRLLDAVTRTVIATGANGSDGDDSVITSFSLPSTADYILQVYLQTVSDTGLPNYTVSASLRSRTLRG
jgi:hypothetical protein